MVKVKLDIKNREILNGQPKEAELCPIALAATKVGFKGVSVDEDSLIFSYPISYDGETIEDSYYFPLPKVAKNFVYNFDHEEQVKPFSFIVRIPNKIALQLKLKKKALAAAA